MVPTALFVLLLGLHVLLAARYHERRSYFHGGIIHSAYAVVIDQTRVLQGYHPITPPRERGTDPKVFYDGRRESVPQWSNPRVLWHELTQGRLSGSWRSSGYWNDPSLSFLLPAVIHGLSGGSILAVLLTPQIFLAVMLLSVYGIGRRAGGPWVGLVAAAVASGYPGIVELAHTHHDSLATGALAIAVVCLLQFGDGFSRLGACMLAGVALFVSSCAGETVSGFMLVGLIVVGPIVGELAVFLRRATTGGARRALHDAVGLVFFAAPLFLLFDWSRINCFMASQTAAWDEVSARATVGSHVPEALVGLVGLFAYVIEMAFDYVQPLMTLWLVAGAVLLYRAPRGGRLAMVSSVAVPLVLLSVMPKKASWYILPVLPGLAVITVLGLRGIGAPKARRWSLALAAACGIATPLFYSFAPPAWQRSVDVDRISPLIKSTVGVCGLYGGFNWSRSSEFGFADERLAAAGHELVALDRQRAAEGPRLVAAFGQSSHQLDGFRYVVELTQPELFVIDFLNPVARPETLRQALLELEDAHFDYLVIFGNAGVLVALPAPSWNPLRTRADWAIAQHQLNTGERDLREREALLRHQVRVLLRRHWRCVETNAGPVYQAADDHP